MRTITFLVILIISAFLLIGADAGAQQKPVLSSSNHDWVDSLAIQFRRDYILDQLLKDKDTLAHYKACMDQYREEAKNARLKEQDTYRQASDARHQYEKEKQVQKIRKRAYKKEVKAGRTDFTHVPPDN
jgi:hypothetical protein